MATAEQAHADPWVEALAIGLQRWCHPLGPGDEKMESSSEVGVLLRRFRPRSPLLIFSGCTPGPLYHSHPHVPAEFDHCPMDMAGQVHANMETIRKIAMSIQSVELPFVLPDGWECCMEEPQLVHWVSSTSDYEERLAACSEVTRPAAAQRGMARPEVLGSFPTGGNVSDRRFLLETFAMFSLGQEELHPPSVPPTIIRLDIEEEYDSKYFMPYVPGFLASGGDLVLFSVTAAAGEDTVSASGELQTRAVIDRTCRVLEGLGCTFDDVVMLWDKVVDLDQNEEAVLFTRSRMGLHRPIAESVLEVDSLGTDTAGTPLLLEYIVVAQVHRRSLSDGQS